MTNDQKRLAVWLGNPQRKYADGVAIFKDLGVNADRNVFYSKKTVGKMEANMLLNDLQRYARINKIKPISVKAAKKQLTQKTDNLQQLRTKAEQTVTETGDLKLKIVRNNVVMYNELPDDLKTLYDGFAGLFETYETKRMEMLDLPPEKEYDAKRKELAETVLSAYTTIRDNWAKLEEWQNKQNTGDGNNEPFKPEKASGKFTLKQIETIEDEGLKALCKQKRVEANMKYIARNNSSDKEKTLEEVTKRKAELDNWNVDYAKLLNKAE